MSGNVYDRAQIANPTIKKENFVSIKDCSGIIYTCWDDSAFYFAVTVTDDVFSQNYTGNQINNGDSLPLFLTLILQAISVYRFITVMTSRSIFLLVSFSGITPEAFIYFPSRALHRPAMKSSQSEQERFCN